MSPDQKVSLGGCRARASPVAHPFEVGRWSLHGRFEALEKELLGLLKRAACTGDRRALEAGEDYRGPGKSPDRADAMVWGITELMLGMERGEPRVVGL